MAEPDVCGIIARQVANALDREMSQAADVSPHARAARQPKQGERTRLWHTPEGWLAHDIGPKVVPLSISERISLKGNISGWGVNSNRLATLVERYENQSDIYSRGDFTFLNMELRRAGLRHGFDSLSTREGTNVIELIEGRTLELNQYGIHVHDPGSMQIAPVSQNAQRAAEVIKAYLADRDTLAVTENIANYKSFGPNYFPIMLKTEKFDNKFQQRAVDGLAEKIARQNGRTFATTDDIGAANLLYENYINKQYAKVGANIQRERIWDVGEGRITDIKEVMSRYSQQYWKAIHEKRIFGERATEHAFPDSVRALMGASELEARIAGVSPLRARQEVDTLIQDTFGIIPADPIFNSTVVRTLNSLQPLKLSLSVFHNASQTGSTWMATNGKSVMQAVLALVTNSEKHFGIPARDFAGMMASVYDEALYNATLWQGGPLSRVGEAILKYTGFTPMESVNRAIAGISGAIYAQQQARLLVRTGAMRYRRQLQELGINVERLMDNFKKTGSAELALEEKLLAGQKIINGTQFRARQSDLPYFATNNPQMWRALLTFRTFAINHSRFIINQAHRKPGRTLLFGLGVMPTIGFGVNFLHDAAVYDLPGTDRPASQENQDGMSNYLEAAAAAGSFGYVSDLLYNFYQAGELRNYARMFTPAAVSSAEDLILATAQTVRGNFGPALRTWTRQLGGLGAGLGRWYLQENE